MRTRRGFDFFEFMPWHVTENADGCPDDRPYGVVNDTDDSIEGCHATEAEADQQIESLREAESGEGGDATLHEVPFQAVIAVEGFDTGDGRLLEVNGWRADGVRQPPLPLWIQTVQSAMGGHDGAFIGGRIETIERMTDGRRLYATGFKSTASEQDQWAEEQIRQRNLRFVSIDVGQADVEYEVREVDEDGLPIDVLARFNDYEITGATVCGTPAIAYAVIWLDGMEPPAEFTAPLPDEPERVDAPEVIEGEGGGILLLASGRDDNGHPPAEWFDDPDLDELTHVTVTAEGRVYGHLAPWGECHIGMPGCVTAPRSNAGYSHFASGETLAHCDCDDADSEHLIRIPTGRITIGTTHAARGLSAMDAIWHYDHTGSCAARVAIGEDDFGIWIAGVVAEDATEAQIRDLRGADVSGDWRRLGGQLELIAVLACNVAGFSIPRQPQAHLVASGAQMIQTTLIAPVGTPQRRGFHVDPRVDSLHQRLQAAEREVARLRTIAEPLRALAASAMVAEMRKHPSWDAAREPSAAD